MKTIISDYFKRVAAFKCLLYKFLIIAILYSMPGLALGQNLKSKNDSIITPFEDVYEREIFQAYRFKVIGAGQLDAVNSRYLRLVSPQVDFSLNGTYESVIMSVPETYVSGNVFPRTFLFNSKADNFRIVADKELGLSGGGVGKTSGITPHMTINSEGKVGIGTDFKNISPANRDKYSLFVARGILSEDYAIGPKSSWADHVFNKEYQLMDLNEVETYITTNKRLPDIPSAFEVEIDGYSLHDMNVKLLQKVEELTLYSIQQNKRIEQLEKIVNSSK